MKQTLISMTILVALLSSSACVKITDKDKGDSTAATPPDHFIEATSKPNEFRVHLTALRGTVEIRRQDLSKNEINADSIHLEASSDGLIDSDIQSGEKYRYQYLSDEGDILKIVEVEVPQDLVIEHEMILTQSPEWKSFYRVYFLNGGILTTNGNKVLLKTKFLYSQHGTLRTFTEGQTAADGKNGRSGGNIQIFAEQASGDLAIELRGENGGTGVSVTSDGADGCEGGDAGNAIIDVLASSLKVSLAENKKGLGGRGSAGSPSVVIWGQHSPAGSNGKNGKDGQPGQFCQAQAGRILTCEQ